MAGKVPLSDISEVSAVPNTGSPSSSNELFPQASELGNISSVARNWIEQTECASDLNFDEQLQEQYQCSVGEYLTVLQKFKRKKEVTFIQMKKNISDKVETMLNAVRQSFEHMHLVGTKKMQLKCEEIGRVLSRVHQMLEESKDVSEDCNREESISNQNFLDKMLQEKQKIEARVETLIHELNEKRENDEQMYMEFREEVQQKIQRYLSGIERSLEIEAQYQARSVEEKITKLKQALRNLQQVSKIL